MTTTTVSPAPAASTERSRQAAGKTVQGAGTRTVTTLQNGVTVTRHNAS